MQPSPVLVEVGMTGQPEKVAGKKVVAIRESWLVEDRWWTDVAVRRRYWEVLTEAGRVSVIFRDIERGKWYAY